MTSESFEPLQGFSNLSLCVCVNRLLSQLWPFTHTIIFPGKQLRPSTPFSLSLGCVVIAAWMWWPSTVYTTHCASVMSQMSPLQTAGCGSSCAALFMTPRPAPPLLKCSLIAIFIFWNNCVLFCVSSVCCGSWLPEQFVQALLPDGYLQGLWREVWSASWPRWPGISCCWPLNTADNIPLISNMIFLLMCKMFGSLLRKQHTPGPRPF